MSIKAVVGVIIVAMMIGVLYVVFEKNFLSEAKTLSKSNSSSAKELPKDSPQMQTKQSSLIQFPTPQPSPAAIDDKTNLTQTAEGLEMRDYSGMFEDLKDSVSK